jgi:hypothetical protein
VLVLRKFRKKLASGSSISTLRLTSGKRITMNKKQTETVNFVILGLNVLILVSLLVIVNDVWKTYYNALAARNYSQENRLEIIRVMNRVQVLQQGIDDIDRHIDAMRLDNKNAKFICIQTKTGLECEMK